MSGFMEPEEPVKQAEPAEVADDELDKDEGIEDESLSAPDNARTVSESDFYGDGKPGEKGEEAGLTDFTKHLNGGSTPDPEAEAKPKDGKDAGEDKAKAEEKAAEDRQREWDKDRQKRDQDAANQRKLVDSLQSTVADQKKAIDDMKALLEKSVAAKGETKADEKTADRLGDLSKQIADLEASGENADAPALIRGVKALHEQLVKLAESGLDSKIASELAKKVESMEAKLAERDAADKAEKERQAAEALQVAERRAVQKLRDHIGGLDKTYGAKFHATAQEEALKILEDQGYSDDNRPELKHAMLVFEHAYLKVAGKKPEARPRPKPASLMADPMNGGRPASGGDKPEVKSGPLRQVIRDMKARGISGQ